MAPKEVSHVAAPLVVVCGPTNCRMKHGRIALGGYCCSPKASGNGWSVRVAFYLGYHTMQIRFDSLDRLLIRLSRAQILAISSLGVAVIGLFNYLVGYEVSISIFYLLPVAAASWYAGLRASIIIALLACSGWFVADIGAGHVYKHLAIPIWNLLVHLSFLVVTGLLLITLRSSLARQQELARTDALTGAFGRRAFEERLEHDLELSRRNGTPLTVAFVDLDNFKILNDSHGHAAGDRALRVAAQALREATRRTDTVGRLGGDEFALVLPNTAPDGAEVVIARLLRMLRERLETVAPQLTCSIGVISFVGSVPRLEEAIRAADELMYQAKRKGKNSVTFSIAEGLATVPSQA
jgi:diguanylate cyclase (GGDEF)-like protein